MPLTTLTDPAVIDLLAARDVAVLSTLMPDGRPLSMAMWYVFDDAGIAMISQAASQKVRNLRRDPRASIAVESSAGGRVRCVSMQCHAAFVEDPQSQSRHVDALFARYPEGLAKRWQGRTMPADRVMFHLTPSKVFLHGN